MDRIERMKMVKAMEYIARQINDEAVFDGWLTLGVADGDIPYGDLTTEADDLKEDNAYWYTEDDTFKELMFHFLRKMRQAGNSGGLYCDKVVSGEVTRRYKVEVTYWIVGEDETPQTTTFRVRAKSGSGARDIALGGLMGEIQDSPWSDHAVTIDKVNVEEA